MHAKDANKGKMIKEFISWMLSEGQSMTSSLSYAPLPQRAVEKEKAALAQIK